MTIPESAFDRSEEVAVPKLLQRARLGNIEALGRFCNYIEIT